MELLIPDAYLDEMRQLRAEILEGEATWADAQALRQKYGLTTTTTDSIRRSFGAYDEFASKGWINNPGSNVAKMRETTTLNSDGSRSSEKILALSESDLTDKEALLEAHGFNPVNYKLVSAKSSKWQQGDGKGGTKDLYSSKITVAPISNGLDFEDIKKHFENFKGNVKVQEEKHTGRKVVAFGHFDAHIGRCGEKDEVGVDYNLGIAHKYMLQTTLQLIHSLNVNDLDHFIYIIGQDYFNSSFTGYTTSQDHMQDNCTTFNTIFKKGTEYIIESINLLSSVAPVEVVFVSGNHSRYEEFALACVLEAYYRSDDNVTVDSNSYPRKYIQFGTTCIGITHGSDEKDRIYGLMATEVPQMWADTKQHIWLTGHIHHRTLSMREDHGVAVFSLSAMCNPDRWTVKSGFIGATAGCQAFVFDFNQGLTDIKYFYV